MFSKDPFNSIVLVLAVLAYVGAVRIAIRQRLGEVLRDLDDEKNRHKWQALWKDARSKSTAVALLMPADIVFIGVAIMLMLEFMRVCGSLKIAIDGGIIIGTGWLVALHGCQWVSGWAPATEDRQFPADEEGQRDDAAGQPAAALEPPNAAEPAEPDAGAVQPDAEPPVGGPLCSETLYAGAWIGPLLALLLLVIASLLFKNR